ncbi:MAG: 23S rRNA methyltransferase [Actinomycetota bacterium]|nr:23S rRNA methyltransferase [Actinomycetota bacterium]
MNDEALSLLRCPLCFQPLAATGGQSVGCGQGHRFDLARQGYLPLLGARSRTDTGDDAAMMEARAEFLGAGHFRPIADAVAGRSTGVVLDIGAGTGYYLAHSEPVLGIALDASRYAARRAAKAHPRVGAVLADAWAPLPVRSAAIDTVLVIFAPRTPAEIGRVLRPNGAALVVSPMPAHLAEIRGALGMLDIEAGKADSLQQRWGDEFTQVSSTAVTAEMCLGHGDLRALVAMGPAARHRSAAETSAAVGALPERVSVTLSVTLTHLRLSPVAQRTPH